MRPPPAPDASAKPVVGEVNTIGPAVAPLSGTPVFGSSVCPPSFVRRIEPSVCSTKPVVAFRNENETTFAAQLCSDSLTGRRWNVAPASVDSRTVQPPPTTTVFGSTSWSSVRLPAVPLARPTHVLPPSSERSTVPPFTDRVAACVPGRRRGSAFPPAAPDRPTANPSRPTDTGAAPPGAAAPTASTSATTIPTIDRISQPRLIVPHPLVALFCIVGRFRQPLSCTG